MFSHRRRRFIESDWPLEGAYESNRFGELGWNTGFGPIMPRGHEILTERALAVAAPGAGGMVRFVSRGSNVDTALSPLEVSEIIEGNRDVDIADLRVSPKRDWPFLISVPPFPGPPALIPSLAAQHIVHSVKEQEQKHHALRRSVNQDWRSALAEIVADLTAQHRAIFAETDPRRRLRRIGAALHLIQDSYCPAHTERTASGCVTYVRNYGGYDSSVWKRSGAGREHQFPTDPRDNVHQRPSEAMRATDASREYLQIVFKVIYGRGRGDAETTQEAENEFRGFMLRHFRPC